MQFEQIKHVALLSAQSKPKKEDTEEFNCAFFDQNTSLLQTGQINELPAISTV